MISKFIDHRQYIRRTQYHDNLTKAIGDLQENRLLSIIKV